MSVSRDFFSYISKPYFNPTKEKLSPNTLKIIGKLLVLKFVLAILAYLLVTQVFVLTETERPDRASETFKSLNARRIFILVIAAPFLEELFFRSWLRKRWGIKYFFPVSVILPIWALAKFFGIEVSPFFTWTTIAVFFCYIAWAIIVPSEQDNIIYVNAIFPYAFWLSVMSFALLHLTNFKPDQIGMWGILVVLPQFIGATFYGYIVHRFGIWITMGSHAVWNGTLAIISYGLNM
jgi:membrane protease YdiL (CAAX protease family)